jgi:hypothetical protein
MISPLLRKQMMGFVHQSRAASTNKRATELHYGIIQSSTTVTLTSGVMKCWVYVDGATVAQLCRYNAAYVPSAGDHVAVLFEGSDKRLRQRYIVAFALARS